MPGVCGPTYTRGDVTQTLPMPATIGKFWSLGLTSQEISFRDVHSDILTTKHIDFQRLDSHTLGLIKIFGLNY